MILHRSPRGACFFVTILGFLMTLASSPLLSEQIPTGTLNVDRNLVRTGVNSHLDWNIQYPKGITEVIDILPPGTIIPKKNLTMKVRTLGVSFQQSATRLLPVDIYWSKNNGSWDRFFYGYGYDVNPSSILVSEKVKKNDRIDFGGRGWLNSWLSFYNTRSQSNNLVVLKNGDTPPSYAPAFGQGNIISFLRPYLSGGKINIGDRDLILLWEVYSTSPGSSFFDMQDIVVMVTFE